MKTITLPQDSTAPLRRFGINLITSTILASALCAAPVMAQQVGGIKGKTTAGVTITASSPVMPKARSVVADSNGNYNLPLLIPGIYQLTVKDASGQERQQQVEVLLGQTVTVDLTAKADGDIERIAVVGSSVLREGNSALTNSLGQTAVENLPIGQNYRDLLKLVPGVQYSENTVLGPSAGGSGVDNKYGFDGVDVSLPMFGNLASEPSTHDIASVSIDRGGAKAIGFNRSGGFAINTISKSGTNEFKASAEYKIQDKSMVADIRGDTPYELDKSWLTANVSGPLIQDTLFFYGSYYAPEESRENKRTAYGDVKSYSSDRDEYFGKLTWQPTNDWLLNLSQRSSERVGKGFSIGPLDADSVSQGETAKQDIFTFDGSYVIGSATTFSFNAATFRLDTANRPDNLLTGIVPKIGDKLNVSDLNRLGAFRVPTLLTTATTPAQIAYNNVAQALINQFGYKNDAGVATGGGRIGANSETSNQNFSRDSLELALDHEFELADMQHQFHVGFKYSEIGEELSRLSNGWGSIAYVGGLRNTSAATGSKPIFFETTTQQMSIVDAAGNTMKDINSYAESYNLELNDTITDGAFVYNLGVLISQDILYGQGLREKAGTVSGFERAPGNKYKMYTIKWQDMIQPRAGVTWTYDGENTLFANYAAYNPEASSLARAASWDRNNQGTWLIQFDQNGNYLANTIRATSSGKVFADDLTPRRIDEFTIGTTKALTQQWFGRAHIRHRKGSHFWEDVWNFARTQEGTYGPLGGVPAHIRARGDYVPNLAAIRAEIGGSTYVIAEVDDGYTKYWEASLEAEYIGERTYLNLSYVWSRYRGNFDQDNTTTVNDANTFIGSSFYNDDKGKYSWDNKDGTLSSDKPHLFKAYGYYTLDWEANIGAYLLFQSGQAWETWDSEYYGLTPRDSYYSTSAYAERAGSRRSASHWQVDLNYTQDFQLTDALTMKFRADIFNLFDRQTGYNIEPVKWNTRYGQPRSWYNPRRIQLSVKIDY